MSGNSLPAGRRRRDTGDKERTCIVTRNLMPTARMIRFVCDPNDVVTPDINERLPGRGLWLLAQRDILEKACTDGAFSRAARGRAVCPPDLVGRTEAGLVRRCLDLVGLARRAGQAVAGFEKVSGRLARGGTAVLLAASDGADDGRSKLRARAGTTPEIALFTRAELGAAFGRDSTVHGALADSKLTNIFLRETGRLAGFRAGE